MKTDDKHLKRLREYWAQWGLPEGTLLAIIQPPGDDGQPSIFSVSPEDTVDCIALLALMMIRTKHISAEQRQALTQLVDTLFGDKESAFHVFKEMNDEPS